MDAWIFYGGNYFSDVAVIDRDCRRFYHFFWNSYGDYFVFYSEKNFWKPSCYLAFIMLLHIVFFPPFFATFSFLFCKRMFSGDVIRCYAIGSDSLFIPGEQKKSFSEKFVVMVSFRTYSGNPFKIARIS